MDSVFHLFTTTLPGLGFSSTHHRPCIFLFSLPPWKTNGTSSSNFRRFRHVLRLRVSPLAATNNLTTNSVPPRSGIYTVGDLMMRKENLHIVKPTTSVNEALETLVEHRITGFPVIDDDWKLVGVVSDCDLLALDSILGHGQIDNCMFPEVDTTWKYLDIR